jgi:hypothetical protein
MGMRMPVRIIEQQVEKAELSDLELKGRSSTSPKDSRNRKPIGKAAVTLESQHLELAAKSWANYSLPEQLAHIGSEVSRTIRARGNHPRYWGAVSRALDLFHLTIKDPRWKGRLREILRVRELFSAAALGSNEFNTTLEDLDNYFYYFALLARSAPKRVSSI